MHNLDKIFKDTKAEKGNILERRGDQREGLGWQERVMRIDIIKVCYVYA
jgi:hypothetical protein